MSEHFGLFAERVEQMEARRLTQEERKQFVNRALDLRFDVERALGIGSLQMLQPRREEDTGTDLWRTYNVIQENLLRGGSLGLRRGRRDAVRQREPAGMLTALWRAYRKR